MRRLPPQAAELPTRRLPRTVDPADEYPTALLVATQPEPDPGSGAAPDATSAASAPDLRRAAWPEPREPRTLRRALLAAAVSTLAPGAGHLLLRRRRLGTVLLGLFAFGVVALVVLAATLPRAQLLENLLSTRVLIVAAITCLGAAVTWMAVIVHAYLVSRPAGMRPVQRLLGAATVTALCLVVATPLGLAANLADSQRSLLDALFPSGGSAAAIGKPRLNLLLVGSDAGPDRTGTRTDTMMVASIDTSTGRTTLFGLPRNIGFARFPPGSPMAQEFPKGFHDRADPLSGDYLLNAVYAYGHSYPQLAPRGPTPDPGLNLLQSSISYMLGLPIDYQIVVDMAGFAALIDALGGLQVDVGPERIPIGGISPSGREVRPEGYLRPGIQQLSGEDALAFARSRAGSTDYVRMGRQRCLIQYVLDQKSPTDLLTNFQGIARATTDSVSTNIPREVLPALAALAGGSGLALESVAFDPNLPDPNTPDGRFNTFDPDVPYMREVVREAISRPAAALPGPPPATSTPTTPSSPTAREAAPSGSATATRPARPGATGSRGAQADAEPEPTAVPQSLSSSC
ncbi:MAG: LCP family protein [Pseudonocardia sp.]